MGQGADHQRPRPVRLLKLKSGAWLQALAHTDEAEADLPAPVNLIMANTRPVASDRIIFAGQSLLARGL